MCALVVGAAFADTTVGGAIFVGGKFLNGTNEADSYPQTGAVALDNYNTLIKLTFGDNSAGGWLSIHNNNGNYYHWFGWWQPIPQVRVQIGRNTDGNFGTAQITGWGFTGESKNGLGAMGEYSGEIFGLAHARRGFYEGTGGTPNFQLSLYPIEGLAVNLWVPFTTGAAGFSFGKFEANVVYRLTDIGNVTLSFKSNTGYLEPDPVKGGPRVKDADYKDDQVASWWVTEQTGTPQVFFSFFLTAIDNMAVDLGVAYQFPLTYKYDIAADEINFKPQYTYEYNQNYPIEIGLGFRYTAGDFGFKLRSAFSIGGTVEATDAKTLEKVESKDLTKISVNILPTYKIGTVTLYLYAGMGLQIVDDYEETTKTPDMSFGGYTAKVGGGFKANESTLALSWFVNPYLFIPAGGMRFQVGFQLYSDGVKYPNGDDALIKWSIPIGFYTYF